MKSYWRLLIVSQGRIPWKNIHWDSQRNLWAKTHLIDSIISIKFKAGWTKNRQQECPDLLKKEKAYPQSNKRHPKAKRTLKIEPMFFKHKFQTSERQLKQKSTLFKPLCKKESNTVAKWPQWQLTAKYLLISRNTRTRKPRNSKKKRSKSKMPKYLLGPES